MGFYYFTIYFRVYWNSIPAAQHPHFIHFIMQTFGETIWVWNFKRLNFGHLFNVQPVWLLRISTNAETISSLSSPVYHWSTSLRAAPWFPILTARQQAAAHSLDKKPKAEHAKVNDGTEDGGPEYLLWSWGRGEQKRMIDRLCGEWTEQIDRLSSTKRAPSAVSSGDSFHCADMCGERSMLGTRQAAVSHCDDGLNMIEWGGGEIVGIM